VEIDENALGLLTEGELYLLATRLGLPLDDGPTAEVLRARIKRTAW
jgi:hypothetical protein